MQNGHKETTREKLLVQKNVDKFVKTWDETYQKSVQENKKMPLFLKHFHGCIKM